MCHTLHVLYHVFRYITGAYSLVSSLMLSSHLLLYQSFFLFPAIAYLTYSWWYPPLPSLTRGHIISVVISPSYRSCYTIAKYRIISNEVQHNTDDLTIQSFNARLVLDKRKGRSLKQHLREQGRRRRG